MRLKTMGRGFRAHLHHMRDSFEFGPRMHGDRGPHGREQGHRGRGGGRHGGRALDHGDLRLLILQLIHDRPSHGYELIKAIDELSGGAYSPSPGVIYPTLALLEETSCVEAVASGAKKQFTLTDEGRVELERAAPQVARILERLAEVKARFGGEPAPEVLRAVQNLRAALRVRLDRGPVSAEEVTKITALLDQAAQAIERV